MIEPDAVDAALTPRTRDRLQHTDELDPVALETYEGTYRVSRRRLMNFGGLLSLLGAVTPTSLLAACTGARKSLGAKPGGRTHTVESTPQTVRLGAFDATQPDILEIEPGDTVMYANT